MASMSPRNMDTVLNGSYSAGLHDGGAGCRRLRLRLP
ncbi:hypothetical protein HaLaN_16325, partial [Haematococcus lacustris]